MGRRGHRLQQLGSNLQRRPGHHGRLSIVNVPPGQTYWLKAWRDANGDLTNDFWEAQGVYPFSPLNPTGFIAGVDISLSGLASFTVTAAPSQHGTPQPQGYGTWYVGEGSVVTNAVGSPVPGTNGELYVCTGWSGSASIPASGNSTSAVVMVENGATLTWHWYKAYFLDTGSGTNGSVDVNDGPYSAGTQVTVTATANSGWRFDHWVGDVPVASAADNPLNVTLDQSRTVSATFIADHCAIYVDPILGDDTYTGFSPTVTPPSGPKKTAHAGLGIAHEADTVIFKDGTYNENLDVAGRNVKARIEGRARF